MPRRRPSLPDQGASATAAGAGPAPRTARPQTPADCENAPSDSLQAPGTALTLLQSPFCASLWLSRPSHTPRRAHAAPLARSVAVDLSAAHGYTPSPSSPLTGCPPLHSWEGVHTMTWLAPLALLLA